MERLEIEILARVDGLTKSLNAAQAKLEKFGKAAEDLGASLTKALTLPIVGLGAASLKAFGDIQSLKNGLTAVTGSADEAAKQFVRLQVLAKLPGLGLPEVAKGSINLQTIGFTAEKAEKSMAAFGNAVATVGKGRDEFERAIYGLQQLANTDFPLGEDLNILKDAIPQVTPLLKEAFGTARTEELQKLGITSAQVVDTIVNGLSKLPAVTGGINGAFENLGDGVKTNLAEIGESINEAFNISALIDIFIEKLTMVTQAFKSLSPETQKIIIIIAGLVAAIGPLLLIIGTLATTVIPAVISGITVLGSALAFIFSPIGLIVVAIAAAVALIIYNWDSIVAYFTTGDGASTFTELKRAFNAAIVFIKDLWTTFIKYLKLFWDTFGADIIAATKFYFGIIMTYLKTVFNVIASIFKAGSAILHGEWGKAGTILLNMTKGIWNGILSIITDVLKAGGTLVAKFFEAIGADKFAKKLKEANDAILDFVKNKFSFNIPIEVDVKDKDGNAIKTDTVTPPKKTITNKAIVKPGDKTDAPTLEFPNLTDDRKSFKEYMDKLVGQGGLKVIVPKSTIQLPKLQPIEVGNLINLDEAKFDAKVALINSKFETLSKTILTSGIQDAFAAIGSSIGESLANGGNVLQILGKSLLSIVGSIATQLGKAAIGIGIAMLGIKAAFKNPLTAIAAGIALVALGSFISSKVANIPQGNERSTNGSKNTPIRAFATGAIISGPTVGLMGEYAGARNNPEIVAPLNKLKGLLPAGQQQEPIILNATLRGEDILISGKRAAKRLDGTV